MTRRRRSPSPWRGWGACSGVSYCWIPASAGVTPRCCWCHRCAGCLCSGRCSCRRPRDWSVTPGSRGLTGPSLCRGPRSGGCCPGPGSAGGWSCWPAQSPASPRSRGAASRARDQPRPGEAWRRGRCCR